MLDLEGAGRHTVFTLYNPYRIVVDIDRRTGRAGGRRGRRHDAGAAASAESLGARHASARAGRWRRRRAPHSADA